MGLFRKQWMLALALGAVAIVLLQTGMCALECSGVLACTEQSSAHNGPSPDTDNSSSTDHCCHGNCRISFVALETMNVIPQLPQPSSRFATFQDVIPDAPVREIDYPPQLS